MNTIIITKTVKPVSPFSMDVFAMHKREGAVAARALDRQYIRAIAGKVRAAVDHDMDRLMLKIRSRS